jgi:hypothetical protein
VLGKTAQMLRVHFSYITESVQEAVRRPKPVSPAPLPPAPVVSEMVGNAQHPRACNCFPGWQLLCL